jgi:hypothetical protein
MNPDNAFTVVAEAILTLLTRHSDLFVMLGQHLFRGFAVILLAWFGIKAALSAAEGGPAFPVAKFAGLVLTIAFGYTMITYYAAPIPGLGFSFSHLVTDQAHALAARLEIAQAQEIERRLIEVFLGLEQPSVFDVLAVVRYTIVMLAVTAARAVLVAVIAFGWIATAVAVLVGPVFIPFFIVPQLDWLFWGWLKAFLQYAFYQVIAQAFVFVFGNLLLHFTQAVPPPYTAEVIVFTSGPLICMLCAFIYGMLKVPSLVNSLFTGRSGESSLPAFLS